MMATVGDAHQIRKYPRTPHLEGSRLQPGDEDLSQVGFAEVAGLHLVVEEKVDGANAAVSFGADGELLLQSRGHYLTGGNRERHYALMKQWAAVHEAALHAVLGSRYVMYGEWMYAKHTVFYDDLPHYFLEFDVLDRETNTFLDTPSRRELLMGLAIASVPVLAEGTFYRIEDLLALAGRSRYVTDDPTAHLTEAALRAGVDPGHCVNETDVTGTMEGLYLKVEEAGRVVRRLKYVRAAFVQRAGAAEGRWDARAIVCNRLDVPLESLYA